MSKKNLIIERGKRLQALRKKVGLTRLAFAEQTGMSANTLKALELGDRELTPQKALLFSNLFSGLFSVSLGEDAHEASFDYLFYGKKDDLHEQKELFINDSDDLHMHKEISSLKSNPSYATLQIQDELMSPLFNKGDIVAGKKIVNKNHFPFYQGCICIIESLEGHIVLRRVIKSDNRLITSCILNTNMNSSTNIIEENEVKYIAQAIWHWHLSQLMKTAPTSD